MLISSGYLCHDVNALSILETSNYDVSEIDNKNITFDSYKWGKNKIRTLSQNPTTEGSLGRPIHGSSYWTTSNIREWLNSNKTTVGYTSNPPSAEFMEGSDYAYDKEAGFLSNFTEKEQNAIAITERRIWVSDADAIARDGGGWNSGHNNIYGPAVLANHKTFVKDYKSFGYKVERDKVFLLSIYETYWYLNRRNFTFSRPLTEAAKRKNNVTNNNYDWYLTGGTFWNGWEYVYTAQVSSGMTYRAGANNRLGIVPAINIKPSYIFDDGRKASSLKIGDTVQFGTYLGEKINWQVINISDTGYPLLLTVNAIDLKKYDATGDQSKVYSEHINFGPADVSLFNDVQFRSTTGMSDEDLPVITVKNENELNIRQNESFDLQIEVSDAGSGIDYVIKPDGTRTTDLNFTYTVTSNGKYTVKAMDKAGNYIEFLIPVSNINISPDVEIRQSTKEWTNTDVKVDVTTSNNIEQIYNRPISNLYEIGGSYFPNYISYIGKEFRITGKLKLIYYNDVALAHNASIGVGFAYNTRQKNDYTYQLGGIWNTIKNVSIKDLVDNNNEMDIDFTWTIPDNYAEQLRVFIRLGPAQALGYSAEVELVDIKYQLIDDSDFKITEITLPDGNKFQDKIFTGFITEEGIKTHTYKVIDNRGKVTTKSIITKIDKTKPTVEVTKLAKSNKDKHYYSVKFYDGLSTIQSISYPGKTETLNGALNKTVEFSVSTNGVYKVSATDKAGNITTVDINVTDIDKNAPNAANINLSRDGWGQDNVNFTLTMPHNKNVKIAIIEDMNNVGNMINKLNLLGYSFDMLIGENDINKLKKYDVVILDVFKWTVSAEQSELLKQLYDIGVSVWSMGNDSNSALYLIENSKHAGTTPLRVPVPNRITEYSYLAQFLNIAEDNEHVITSLLPGVDIIMSDGTLENYPALIKIENGLGGEWIHSQSLIRYFDKNRYTNEYIMGIIDDLTDYNDDTGISNIEYKINDGNWIEYRGETITISTEGYHTVYARVTDNSGKQSLSQKSFGVDRTEPTATITGPKDTYSQTISLSVNAISGTISKATKVEFSENSNFTGSVSSVNLNGNTNISYLFTLQEKSPVSANFGDRIVYARITDEAGNKKIISHKTKLRPEGPKKPTFVTPKSNGLYLEPEAFEVKWTYSDTNGFPLAKSILRIYDSSNKLLMERVHTRGELSSILNLPKGIYVITVENFNSHGESSISDKLSFRVNNFLNTGNILTKDIRATQNFTKIKISTTASIPQNTIINGKVFYEINSSGINRSKYIAFNVTQKELETNVINLPTAVNNIRIEYTLIGSDDKYVSPEIDVLKVYAR